jgi:hypothetical protein
MATSVSQQERITKWLRNGGRALVCIVALGAGLVAIARAEPLNRVTEVKFGSPVALPDRVVQPGIYEFKLLAPDLVRITSSNGHLVGTYIAQSADRVYPAAGEIVLEEQPGSAPMAVSEWFFEGDSLGVKLLYGGK